MPKIEPSRFKFRSPRYKVKGGRFDRFDYWGQIGAGEFAGMCQDNFTTSLPDEQSTGLCDRNAKELWQGDIVNFRANYTAINRCGWHDGIIVWNEYTWAIRVPRFIRPDDYFDNSLFMIGEETEGFASGNFTIIGNIHSTPELCK